MGWIDEQRCNDSRTLRRVCLGRSTSAIPLEDLFLLRTPHQSFIPPEVRRIVGSCRTRTVSIRFTPASRAIANGTDKARVRGSFGDSYSSSVRPKATLNPSGGHRPVFPEHGSARRSCRQSCSSSGPQQKSAVKRLRSRWRRKRGQDLVAEIPREHDFVGRRISTFADGSRRFVGRRRFAQARRDRHATTATVHPSDRATTAALTPSARMAALIHHTLHRD